jgi:hypothetical protein
MTETEVGRRRGRRRTLAEANEVAAGFEASGLGREEFSRQQDIPMKTLARYIARYRREKGGACNANAVQRWVAVEVGEPRGRGHELAVVLPRGRRIEVQPGFDGETLRRLVMALERV